ncbi:hypothetical protein EJV47_07505 [Hymenobacter gummosus]|uniref:Uncharacterized protein n=1 Tax=Hymenobacter gummosus TaxID=1776032 RepID=A0A3S0HAZ3_9BACT|nr:hypothetical protein [Hymenobacter gummosus]RTQ51637.1 hypothetical protein EJV47_07505 [Hymenobacter gummosus]
MTAASIIREIEALPLTEKLLVVERTLKSIRTNREKALKTAADSLYDDYKSDAELTVFTQLDAESFYEAR